MKSWMLVLLTLAGVLASDLEAQIYKVTFKEEKIAARFKDHLTSMDGAMVVLEVTEGDVFKVIEEKWKEFARKNAFSRPTEKK